MKLFRHFRHFRHGLLLLLALLLSAQALSQTVNIHDTFTGSGGTLLEGRTSDTAGGLWSEHPGFTSTNLQLTAGARLRADSTTNLQCCTSAATLGQDYDVEFDVYVASAAGIAGCLFRSNNNASPTDYRFYYQSGNWKFARVISGSLAQRVWSSTENLTVGNTYNVKIVVRGFTFSVFINSGAGLVERMRFRNTEAVSGTKVGPYMQGFASNSDSLGYQLDNFKVTTPANATAVTLSGPTIGPVSAASQVFTAGANGNLSGSVVVTPADGGAGGTFTPTTVTLTTTTSTATFTYTAPATPATRTISVTNGSGLSNPSNISYDARTTIAVNDANIYWSPYTWRISGSAYAHAALSGSYIKMGITGTSVRIVYDPLLFTGCSQAEMPRFRWRVDSAKWQVAQLTQGAYSLTLATGLSAGAHTAQVYWYAQESICERWGEVAAVATPLRIYGIAVDSGSTSAAPETRRPKNALFLGDSITEGAYLKGVQTLYTNYFVDVNDAQYSWVWYAADALNAEYGQVGVASIKTSSGLGSGGWQNLLTSWPYYDFGNSRLVGGLLSPLPDYIWLNIGQNDSATADGTLTTDYTSLLTAIRAAAPSSVIFAQIPFAGTKRSAITAAVQAMQVTDRRIILVDFGATVQAWFGQGAGTFVTSDQTHPSEEGTRLTLGPTVAKKTLQIIAPKRP